MRRIVILAMMMIVACSDGSSQKAAPKLRSIADFELVDHDGRSFRHASLQGRQALLFFGYTRCPDACPITMSKVARAYRLAGDAAKDTPTLFISVDPRDTPPVLKRYLSYFAAVPARGLTGSQSQIDHVTKQFGVRYEIRDVGSAAGPVVDHTLRLFLLDREGDVIAQFDPPSTADEIADAMRKGAR